MIYFVTGLHRAGTHSFAQYKAEELKLPYVEESVISWDSLDKAIGLKDMCLRGYVLQCPGLAHKSFELSEHGRVYWVTRNKLDVVTSMKNANIGVMAWHIMKGFRQQFPDDEVWETLKYDGQRDHYFKYIGYYDILVDVKEYFYNKYFKDIAELVQTEDMPYYNYSSTLTSKKGLKELELESIRLCKI